MIHKILLFIRKRVGSSIRTERPNIERKKIGSDFSSPTIFKSYGDKNLIFAPIIAIKKVPGKIPSAEATKYAFSLTPRMAGAKLTIQNGKIGKSLKMSMYLKGLLLIPKSTSENAGCRINLRLGLALSPV